MRRLTAVTDMKKSNVKQLSTRSQRSERTHQQMTESWMDNECAAWLLVGLAVCGGVIIALLLDHLFR